MITDRVLADEITKQTNRGYWSVNRKFFFFNKLEALRYASHLKTDKILYHYLDDFYRNLKWDLEPSESLEEYYKRRAQCLRDKYDYLVLSFSGGSDSTNVLDTFVNNGIHLDEVITSYPRTLLSKLLPKFNKNDKFHGNSPFEYYLAAKPRLERLSKENSKIKITDIDVTDTALSMPLSGNMIDLSQAGWPPTIPIVATYLPSYKRVREISESGKRVCWINGNDKPRILYCPGEQIFKTYMQDISFTHGALGDNVLDGFKPHVENFYINQEIYEIVLKQCALIKKALTPIFVESDLSKIKQSGLFLQLSPGGNYIVDVHSDFIKKILYKNWDTSIFQANKPNNQGKGDGTGYWYYHSGLLDKRLLDHAWGQNNDWYGSIDQNILIKDEMNRDKERIYPTETYTLRFVS
jgi:hypothetical protein